MSAMELLNALEFLRLSEIPKDWVDSVWDHEFTEAEPLDEPIEEEITSNGSKAFRTLYNRLQTYATNAAESEESSQSVWTVFRENDVSAESLVALLSYFILGGKPKTASVQKRVTALQAASLYVLLLGIPGSVANKVYHEVLFETCTAIATDCMPQSSGKKRKKDKQLKSSQADKRPKPHRKENTEMDFDDGEEEQEEVPEFSAQDLLKIRDAIFSFVKTLIGFLLAFPLRDRPENANNCAQIFAKMIDFEPTLGKLKFGGGLAVEEMRTMPELAYHGLWLLCSPNHGDERKCLLRVFRKMLYVILMMRKGDDNRTSLLPPNQTVLAGRDQAINFVCYVVDEVKEPAVHVLNILLTHFCCQMVEKAEYRTHGAQAVSMLLTRMPCEPYAKFIKWLYDYARNDKVVYRMFALDVAITLLEQPERIADADLSPEMASFLTHRFLTQEIISRRTFDVSPSVRAHALNCLAQCVEQPSLSASSSVQEPSTLCRSNATRASGVGGYSVQRTHMTSKTYRTIQFRTIELSSGENGYETKEGMEMVMRRHIQDPKTNVRKSALQAMMILMKHNQIEQNPENLHILSERCRDPALSVKKKALQCLVDLLTAQPETRMVQKAWLNGVVPAIIDPESSVQEKVLECLEQAILKQVKNHSSYKHHDASQKLAWDLLGLLCDECSDLSRYFSKAFTVWSKQNKFTPTFIDNLVSHTKAQHASGAWLLLSQVISSSPRRESVGMILEAWEDMISSKNVTVTTSCHILRVMGDISKGLNEDTRRRIVDDIMTWLKRFDLPLEVVNDGIETLCRLGSSDNMEDTQAFLNQHCGELVAICEAYLYNVLLTEDGPQNMNKDLVVKHLFTLGAASLHCPSKINKRTVLLLQSILTSSVAQPQELGSEELPASQPLSQFRPNNMPSVVRAQAVLTLGKLCLQHEEMTLKYLPVFARTLEQGTETAVRNNVVVVMCDLCVRYTNMVDRYIPNISVCLSDPDPLIRQHSLTMLTNLLQEEFVKWKGSLFFRFVVVVEDPDPAIASLCRYCLVHLLLKKNPAMFYQHFVESIFHFNGYEKHPTYNKFPQSAREKETSLLKGAQNKERRFRIYRFLLKHFTDADRFNTTLRICTTVLECFAEGDVALDTDGAEVLAETFSVLSLKEMKLQVMSSKPDAEAEEQDDEEIARAKVVVQVAQKKVVSQVQKKIYIDKIIPTVISLKRLLEEKRSPVLKDLMGYLQVTMQDYRNEIKEFFAADEQLGAELEYNLKTFEEQQALEKQMANISVANISVAGGTPAGHPPGSLQASVQGTPARAGTPAAQLSRDTNFATPQPLRPVLNSPRLVQSARPLRVSNLRLDSNANTPQERAGPAKAQGKAAYRAISTPHGGVGNLTFGECGEGFSTILGDQSTAGLRSALDTSSGQGSMLLVNNPPEDEQPAARQWNVESPLKQRKPRPRH